MIAPLSLAEIDDPELLAMIERARELGVPDGLFVRVLAHVPDYAKALFDALIRSHGDGNVDHKLKEIIRIQLARHNGDAYFGALRSEKAQREGLSEDMIEAGCGDFDADPRFTAAEKWALRYAYLMYRQPKKIDKAFYDAGKRHFSEAEIMDLGAFIAFHHGMQIFMRTLRVVPE